ncbi:uncharacterized protein LODBEIA_P57130 [Lodderomyces beijingensis]|uniref:Uncharacterized protein n=1 Tax=Lodderomyces beijingensis TaxID=1775926 RepID=A0ABP0ZNH2_9ASCO
MRQSMGQGSPMSHKFIVGTIAVLVGVYAAHKVGSDFQFVKYEPHSPEEVERRQREKVPVKMTVSDSATLELTPEAKSRIQKKMQQEQRGQNERD